MTTKRMTFGERMVELFKQEGVEAIFAQGDLTMKDIQKHAQIQGIKTVGPRHEAAGVWMADAYYRQSGKPQVAIGAMGPGQANLLPAAICAAQEHIPVIIMGSRRQGKVDTAVRRSRFLHAPILENFARICKFAANITHLGELDEIVYEAFRQALSGTPGPVYIEYDFVMHEQEGEFPLAVPPQRYRVMQQDASQSDINKAVELLKQANAPLLLAGTGIHTSRTYQEFEKLVSILGCPVITTIGGSGTLPETHPQWLSYLTEPGQQAIRESDLVLALGTSFPETLNYGCQRHFVAGDEQRKWILVEQDTSAVCVNRPIDLPVIGKLEQVLPQLCEALENCGKSFSYERMAELRNNHKAEKQKAVESIVTSELINPSRLMIEARRAVPDNAVVVIDSGLTLMHHIAFFEKRCNEFIWASKYGHLGTGIPYAIGAQLSHGRERPVCLISGDGGVGFHFMEFETAVRHNLPIVIIINDDRSLGAEMASHLDHIGHMIEVQFSPVRFDKMAEAIGGHGEYVCSKDDIYPAVERAFASGKPAIVQVVVDPESAVKFPVPHSEELMSWLFEDAS